MRKCQFIVSLLICIGLVSFLSACESSKEVVSFGNGNVLIVSESVFESAPNHPFTIKNVRIEGDILIIKITSGGCDGSTWQVNLVTTDAIGMSEPPYRGVKLSLKNRELCRAFVHKEFKFNIKNLRVEGSNSVRLNISGIEVLYRY